MFSLPFECEFCLLKLASTPNFIGTESENHFFFSFRSCPFMRFLWVQLSVTS